MILPVYSYGCPILRKTGEIIKTGHPGLKELIDNMFETMYAAEGVGLAAQQVGEDLKIFVIDASPHEENHPEAKGFKKVFINAKLVSETGEDEVMEEGCLSLPGIREDVTRKSEIKIKYQDENLKEYEETYDGILARIIQHEYDHNNGIFFIDKINPLRRILLKNRLNNLVKGSVNVKYKMKFPQIKKK